MAGAIASQQIQTILGHVGTQQATMGYRGLAGLTCITDMPQITLNPTSSPFQFSCSYASFRLLNPHSLPANVPNFPLTGWNQNYGLRAAYH